MGNDRTLPFPRPSRESLQFTIDSTVKYPELCEYDSEIETVSEILHLRVDLADLRRDFDALLAAFERAGGCVHCLTTEHVTAQHDAAVEKEGGLNG